MATSISVGTISTFGSALETGLQSLVSEFKGFGSTIGEDVAAITVDAGAVAKIVLGAFTASGNAEAAIISPLVSIAMGILAEIEGAAGWTTAATTTASTAAATVNTTQPVIPAVPVAPVPAATAAPAVAKTGDDGLGDNDADTGAL